MQSEGFQCPECPSVFVGAAELLQHFALHATKCLIMTNKALNNKAPAKKLPDLYPIHLKSNNDDEIATDSGVEDVNPLRFCLVTMGETGNEIKLKRYQCNYCPKKFGWPTDLKRHTLTHTGERPFPCGKCGSTFTRNFLLKKHQRRCHIDPKSKIPDLKPLMTRRGNSRSQN